MRDAVQLYGQRGSSPETRSAPPSSSPHPRPRVPSPAPRCAHTCTRVPRSSRSAALYLALPHSIALYLTLAHVLPHALTPSAASPEWRALSPFDPHLTPIDDARRSRNHIRRRARSRPTRTRLRRISPPRRRAARGAASEAPSLPSRSRQCSALRCTCARAAPRLSPYEGGKAPLARPPLALR